MPSVLELRALTKDYPVPRGLRAFVRAPLTRTHRRAVDELSLSVEAGEILALLGPNGSGKTSCVKILAGMVLPTSGTALVGGHDVVRAPKQAQSRLGYVVSDERSFHFRLTVRENLRFFGALHGLYGAAFTQRVTELADELSFAALIDRPFRVLSSGQKATVAIARGLLHRPVALLLDEVTRPLDPGAAERLRRFVKDELVGKRGLGVLLTTHDLAEAKALGARVALLVEGRLRASGSYDAVAPAIESTFFEEAA